MFGKLHDLMSELTQMKHRLRGHNNMIAHYLTGALTAPTPEQVRELIELAIAETKAIAEEVGV